MGLQLNFCLISMSERTLKKTTNLTYLVWTGYSLICLPKTSVKTMNPGKLFFLSVSKILLTPVMDNCTVFWRAGRPQMQMKTSMLEKEGGLVGGVWGISSARRNSGGRKCLNSDGNFVLFSNTLGGTFSQVPTREQLCSHVSVFDQHKQWREPIIRFVPSREDKMSLPSLWSVTVGVH